MSTRTERLIFALAILSAAVSFAAICNSIYAGVVVLVGAAFERRTQQVKLRAHRREIQLRRRASTWKRYG